MTVTAVFDNVKVYDVTKFDVVKGQKFSLLSDAPDGARWFSSEDPALTIKVSGKNADVTADELGASEVVIVDSNWNRLKIMAIEVVESTEQASTLGLSAGQPEPK